MARSDTRDLMRRAQAAELAGSCEQAVDLLSQAARLHMERGEPRRASSLWRHCLRLKPDRADLRALAEETEAAGPADETSPRRIPLEPEHRGPARADPDLDCWCSFCCRPKVEAGAMVAGPAGAFVCAECARTCAALLGERAPEAPAVGPAAPPVIEPDFIEAAVVLSRELGWGLADLRTLSPEELRRALAVLARLRQG